MPKQSPDSCISLLQAMIGFDTVNGSISGKPEAEKALAQYLEAQATLMGFETQRLPVDEMGFNLLISHQVAPDAPWLLFESHLDTVSVAGMTVDPFAGQIQIEAGRIYGRGACDTKGTGAAMLWALKQYAAGSTKPNNVAILYTLDEEIGKTGVRTFVGQHLEHLDWRPTGVIVGEPTQLKPVIAHNGIVRWRIKTTGVAAHSSDPSQGRSAIRMMVNVITALEKDYIAALSASHPLTGPAQCSINIIQGGVQINIIPEACEIHLDRRVVPGEDPEQVLPAVEDLLDDLRRADEDLCVSQLEPDNLDYPLDPRGGEALAAVVQGALDQLGLPSALTGAPYGTDASNFGRIGIPAIVLGPGDIAQAHTHDEWLDLDQLQQGVAVYLRLMVSSFSKPSK